jgi:hypothetical protein
MEAADGRLTGEKRMYRILVAAFLVVLSSCATLEAEIVDSRKAMSSGTIGCGPDRIEIGDLKSTGTIHTWTATCGDKKFYCTDVPKTPLSCAPALQ